MTALLDTSVVVRYLTGDPPDQADRAAAVIDGGEQLGLPVVALVETGYVLSEVYQIARSEVVDALIRLLSRRNIIVPELPKEHAIEALLMCRPSKRVSFADALIWAAARTAVGTKVFTFDRRFPGEDIDLQLLA